MTIPAGSIGGHTGPTPKEQLHAIRDQATRHVRPTHAQLEGYRDRLFHVVRTTGYNRDVFSAALAVEDEIDAATTGWSES